MTTGVYCVTDWKQGSGPELDDAFNAIFDDISARALDGAAVLVPPGDHILRAPVRIRHDFLTIAGFNNGFQTGDGRGGGSHIRVVGEIGFHVPDHSEPPVERLRSLTIRDLLLDGGTVGAGRTGILIERANDNVVISANAIKSFENGVVVRRADALHVRDNMILENTACLRLIDGGIASIVSSNRMGGKPAGVTMEVEGHARLVITANNLFPDGAANLVLKNSRACTVTGNQLQSYYTGMMQLDADSRDNVIAANQLLASVDPSGAWNINASVTRPADFGLIRVEGQNNLLQGNGVWSQAPVAHAVMVVGGSRNTVMGQQLRADRFDAELLRVIDGAGAEANLIVDTVDADDLQTDDGVQVRFRPLPSLM
ncbi:MAG: NosD domain-containing protein [Myxococcota bacterium]